MTALPTPTPEQAETLRKQYEANIQRAQQEIGGVLKFITELYGQGNVSSLMFVAVRADGNVESRAVTDGRTNPYMLLGGITAHQNEIGRAIVQATQAPQMPRGEDASLAPQPEPEAAQEEVEQVPQGPSLNEDVNDQEAF